jgi:hypothetical protein
MRWRPVAALLLTPLVGGAIPAISYAVASSPAPIGIRDALQIGAWVVLTVVFEFVFLFPCARYFRGATLFRLRVFSVGLVAWLLVTLTWFFFAFDISLKGAVAILLPVSILGFAVCATFVALWKGVQHV